MRSSFASSIVSFLLLATPAAAHEFWLAPLRYQATTGDTLVVRAFVGTGFKGETKPLAARRVVRLEARTTRQIDMRGLGVNGSEDYARLVLPDAGGASVAYQSDFATIELPGAQFDAYLRLEGLEGPRRERERTKSTAKPGRERYARCCRTWIRGSDLTRATDPLGLALEVLPSADPTLLKRAPFRVLLHGRPLAGALVRAWNRPLDANNRPFDVATRDSLGPVYQGRTHADGTVTLPVDRAGEWLVSCVHMAPSESRVEADWQSLWASFTFARPARPARR
ncbi:MAG: DUF4198 domain-containing protein [Candidatus Eisenbacteria bacterium]